MTASAATVEREARERDGRDREPVARDGRDGERVARDGREGGPVARDGRDGSGRERDGRDRGPAAERAPVLSGKRRVLLTFADQAVSSGSNFLIAVIVGRLAGVVQLGRYLLVITIWLVVVGAHRALVTEPMIIDRTDTAPEDRRVAAGLGAEVLLGLGASVLAAIAGVTLTALNLRTIGSPMLALGVSIVPLLVQDYWRATAFRRHDPGMALLNDIVFTVVQGILLAVAIVLGARSAAFPILAWGAGAVAGALLGMIQWRVRPDLRGGARMLRRTWTTSRWLLADFLTLFASDQAYVLVVAALVTSTEYGLFRGTLTLLGPVMVLLLASGNIALPETSRRFADEGLRGMKRYARNVSIAVAAVVAVYALVVTVFGRALLRVAYDGKVMTTTLLVALLAGQYVLSATAFGQGQSLKVTGHTRALWFPRLLVGAISLTSGVTFTMLFGLSGIGLAGLVTGASYATAIHLVHRSVLGPHHAPLARVPGTPDGAPPVGSWRPAWPDRPVPVAAPAAAVRSRPAPMPAAAGPAPVAASVAGAGAGAGHRPVVAANSVHPLSTVGPRPPGRRPYRPLHAPAGPAPAGPVITHRPAPNGAASAAPARRATSGVTPPAPHRPASNGAASAAPEAPPSPWPIPVRSPGGPLGPETPAKR